MRFLKNPDLNTLNRFTYIKLRWIAFIGQVTAILIVAPVTRKFVDKITKSS